MRWPMVGDGFIISVMDGVAGNDIPDPVGNVCGSSFDRMMFSSLGKTVGWFGWFGGGVAEVVANFSTFFHFIFFPLSCVPFGDWKAFFIVLVLPKQIKTNDADVVVNWTLAWINNQGNSNAMHAWERTQDVTWPRPEHQRSPN